MSIFLRRHYGNSRLYAGQIIREPILFAAFGFGAGLLRFMPGTMGTIAALPFYWAFMQAAESWVYPAAVIVVVALGIPICGNAAKKLAVHDFSGIVWDEIAGYLITMFGLPFSWESMLAGFALFRLFDIVKPWPIGWLDRHVSGGLGIMLDDVAAGIFAALALRLWF